MNLSGVITTNPFEILEGGRTFYKKLYTSKRVDLNGEDSKGFFENENIPKLSGELKEICEGRVRIEEITEVLKSFKDNKVPGIDGLPAEFYKAFWHLLGETLVDSLNAAFDSGRLSISQRQGIITLIDKKDKDGTLLGNWRPISLLNMDVKLLSKALAYRIKKILPNIIHSNQSGYVEGRFIGETIRTIDDIMEFTKCEGIGGILAFLRDFEKAFDSVEWIFLHKCLDVFNFGSDFKKWVSLLYNDISSCVSNNGVHSDFFALERDVRQGDPLSPYLFIATVEILAIAIRTNNNIRGISIGDQEYKLVQYADDTTGILKDEESLKVFLDVLKSYEKVSGLKINISSRNCKREVLGLKLPKRPIKCLGVYLTYDYDEFIKLNYRQRLKKMEDTANWWRGRGLTMLGRAQIIKSLLLSKLIYTASMFPVPEEVIKEANRIIFKFLWKGQDRVARKAMINNFENGGLNVLDFETMVKSPRLAWLRRLLTKPFGGDFLFHCDYEPREYNITNKFYGELIQFWAEFRNAFSTEDDSTSIIWNNNNIRINGKPVFYTRFF